MLTDENCIIINSNNNITSRLICFCHAGGYASQYLAIEKYLPNNVECIIYERPGSGNRMNELVCTDWRTLLKDVNDTLIKYLDKPFILFGLSLGGTVAYEFTRFLQLTNYRLPVVLCIGDRESPLCYKEPKDKMLSELPDNDFINYLINHYDLSKELASDKCVMDYFLPSLRSDFRLVETHAEFFSSYDENHVLDIPIKLFIPKKSIISRKSCINWKKFTHSNFKEVLVSGDHFFPFEHAKEFLSCIFSN